MRNLAGRSEVETYICLSRCVPANRPTMRRSDIQLVLVRACRDWRIKIMSKTHQQPLTSETTRRYVQCRREENFYVNPALRGESNDLGTSPPVHGRKSACPTAENLVVDEPRAPYASRIINAQAIAVRLFFQPLRDSIDKYTAVR